jgi:uncharacterized delta-60 repeat protein
MVGLTVAMAGLLVLGAASPAGAIGELDPTFSTDGRQTANFTGGADPGLAAAVQVDGKILAAGRAGGSGGRMFVSRYNSNGTLDSSFSGDGRAFVDFGPGDDYAADIAIDDDDAIVIVGGAQSRRRIGVARFTANGVPDTTFSGDGKRTSNLVSGNEWADDLVLDSSGRLVVGGVAEFSGVGRFVLVRYNADGSLDTTFSGDGWISADIAPGYDALLALALQGDGKLVASGLVESAAEMRMTVARFTSNGTLDTTFSGDGKRAFNTAAGYEEAAGVAVQDDGKIVMGGESNGRLVLVRLSSTGVPDPAFSGDGIQITNRGRGPEWIGDLRLQDDGKIVIGGVQGGNGGRMLLGRYLTNGDPDTSFSGDGFTPIDFSPRFDIAWDVAIQPDGRIVGVGSADSDQRVALARVVGG